MSKVFLTLSECADHLGISHHTIRQWMRDGKLRVSRLGSRCIRVRTSDLERFIEQRSTGGAE